MKRRLLATLLSLTLMLSLVPSAWAVENEESSQEAVVEEPETELIEGLQVRINALPDADTLAEMDEDEQAKVYAEVCDIYDAIDKLTPEEGKALDVSALEEAAAFFTQQIMPLDSKPTGEMYGDCSATGQDSVNWALTPNSDGSTYTLTISGEGAMADYTVDTKKGEDTRPWSAYKDTITDVSISEGVTSIGDSAFRSMTVLEKANIPASITDLGDHIFREDTALTAVEWAEGFSAPKITDTDSSSDKYIGTYVPTSMFDGCTSLGDGQELSKWLPDSFTGVGCAAFRNTAFGVDFDHWNDLSYIGAYGFAGMPNLTTVTVKSNWKFGLRGKDQVSWAFRESGVTSVIAENGVESIPYGVFDNCTKLTSVSLPESVTTICASAFSNTSGLKSIDLNSVREIGVYAFSSSGLKTLTLPESVTSVGKRAFINCSDLTSLSINSKEVTVDGVAFSGCTSLKTIKTAENTVVTLNGAFAADRSESAACSSVTEIIAKGTLIGDISDLEKLELLSVDGSSGQGDNGVLTKAGRLPEVENLIITGNEWKVGGYSFAKQNNIKNLIVTAGTVTCEDSANAAFRSSKTIETVRFTGNDVKLQPQMFEGCSALKWIDLSKVNTVELGNNCFGNDTNTDFTGDGTNYFNKSCVIYVQNSTDATKARKVAASGAGIILVVNGGEVDTTATAGFAAVTKTDCTAKWYESGKESAGEVTSPEKGKTYIAVWTACNHEGDKSYSAEGTVLTESCAACGHVFGTATIVAPTELAYNGSAKAATVTVSEGWSGDTPTPAYYSGTNELNGAPTDAGTYTAKITAGGVTASVDFTITQATPTIKISADQTSLTGSGTVKLTVTSNGVPAEDKVEVTCDNGITVTKNADGTFTAVLPNETKTYTFTASYNGDANHEKAFGTCKVPVTRRSSSGGSSSSDRSYAVSAPSTKNGDVTVSPKNASKGDRVTITVTPDKGYELDKLTVKDVSGNKLKLTDKGNGKYTFTMPASKVTVSAEFVEEQAASIFADVPTDAYYAKAVEWAVKKGITNGKANGLFGSNDPCTRGQIVTFLWRAAGSPAPKGTVKVPSDVLPGSYCYDAVAWALENGITNGLADGTFGVNNTCTRGQSVTFLYRAMGTAPTTVNGFTDVAADSFCAEAVAWAVENGVTNGTSASTFSPSNGCTRAQIVTFLYRAYQGE